MISSLYMIQVVIRPTRTSLFSQLHRS